MHTAYTSPTNTVYLQHVKAAILHRFREFSGSNLGPENGSPGRVLATFVLDADAWVAVYPELRILSHFSQLISHLSSYYLAFITRDTEAV